MRHNLVIDFDWFRIAGNHELLPEIQFEPIGALTKLWRVNQNMSHYGTATVTRECSIRSGNEIVGRELRPVELRLNGKTGIKEAI